MESEVLCLVDGKWPDPFYATPKVVWEDYMEMISPDAFLLYHVYRYYADSRSGRCWPSISAIARRLRWSWQRVRDARDELRDAALISVRNRGKGRVAIITMLRPKPVTLAYSPVVHDARPISADDTNNNEEQELENNTSQFYLSLLLGLLDREPMPHEMKKAKELVQRLPGERVCDVVDWARTRKKPFGAAVHALEKGYEVGPKRRKGFHRRHV